MARIFIVFPLSLAAAIPGDEHQEEARRYVDEFLAETGWRPDRTLCVAGALLFTQYDFFKRLIMKLIARHEGVDTDAKVDHEYTDWNEVTLFTETFLRDVVAPRVKAAPGRPVRVPS